MKLYDIFEMDVKYDLMEGEVLADYLLSAPEYWRIVNGCTPEELIKRIEAHQIPLHTFPKISARDPGLKRYIANPLKDSFVLERIPQCAIHPASETLRVVVRSVLVPDAE